MNIREAMQKAFNQMYLGLHGQDWQQSYDDDKGCLFEGPNGLHCALGHLGVNRESEGLNLSCPRLRGQLPDYIQENLPLDAIAGEYFLLCLLESAQSIHDEHPTVMEREFRRLAHRNDLTIPEVT